VPGTGKLYPPASDMALLLINYLATDRFDSRLVFLLTIETNQKK